MRTAPGLVLRLVACGAARLVHKLPGNACRLRFARKREHHQDGRDDSMIREDSLHGIHFRRIWLRSAQAQFQRRGDERLGPVWRIRQAGRIQDFPPLQVQYQHRLGQTEANGKAWLIGKTLLEKAIARRLDFAFESTLGANTIPALLRQAAQQGCEVRVWYAGLSSPELHLARVKARVRRGGHDISEADIRRRYMHSRRNLIDLLPHLAALRVYDNSADANPAKGTAPEPVLVLQMERGKILNAADLPNSPDWARPIVAAALRLSLG